MKKQGPGPERGGESQLVVQAREAGRKARREGRSREACPHGSYPSHAFRRVWLEGWDEVDKSLAAEVTVQEPRVATQQVQVVTAGRFWPPGKVLPTHYRRPSDVPCPRCRRTRLDDGSKAVICKSTSTVGDVVYLTSRCCRAEFKLPTESV